MCEPISISTGLAIASTAASVGGAIAGHQAQSRQAREGRENAATALRQQQRDLNAGALEEAAATTDAMRRIQRQVQAAQGQSLALAGAAGVTGQSVTDTLNAMLADAGEQTSVLQRNLASGEQQLARQQAGAAATARNRANQFIPPSMFTTGLQIANAGLSLADRLQKRKPTAKGDS